MKIKTHVVGVLLLSAAVAADAAGPMNGAPRDAAGPNVCQLTCPGGLPRAGRGGGPGGPGNPACTGVPRRGGSGKATAPGRGPKDGTGGRADCPFARKG